MSVSQGMIDRLTRNKHMGFKELIELAEDIGYVKTHRAGSHEKYEKPGSQNLTITISQKRDSSLHQNDVMKILRFEYAKLKAPVLMPPTPKVEELVIEEKSEFRDIPEHCLDSDWRKMIRKIRTYHNKTLSQVADNMYLNLHTYRAIEMDKRLFSRTELNLFCMMFNFDPLKFPEVPLQETVEKKHEKEVINMVDNTEDILTAVELKLARYKELNNLLKNYDELKKEHDILKKQFMSFSKELL